jgi:hypothetical protein
VPCRAERISQPHKQAVKAAMNKPIATKTLETNKSRRRRRNLNE